MSRLDHHATPMTAPTPPALTPAEWRGLPFAATAHNPAGVRYQLEDDIAVTTWTSGDMTLEGDDGGIYVPPSLVPAVIALANAARRDDDPGKITRQDVDDCIAAAQIVESGDGGAPDYEQGARYRALAAKLAALLPPEGL